MSFSPASLPSGPEMTLSKRRPKYSFAWASQIWAQATQSHGGYLEKLVGLLGLSSRQVIYLIACNDETWPIIRDMGHRWGDWERQQERLHLPSVAETTTPTYLLSDLHRIYRKRCTESFDRYLTARFSQLMMEEQVKSRGWEGDSPDQPSLFSSEELEECS